MATPKAAATDTQMATCGLRKRGDTRARCAEPGSPPSRAKAKSIRELDVTEDSPQNHMAPMAIHTSAPPSAGPSDSRSTYRKGLGAAAAAGRSVIASVTATSSAYPTTALTATDRKMPQGALRVGFTVSSETWALAS